MRRLARRLALAPILLLACGAPSAVYALGLGDIELQSALGQRLDAEIPLRGVPAGQGDRVVVALASEQAYRDVGLRRPFSLTHLAFDIMTRPDGASYVRVTSDKPIVEPFLTFLIEVDAPDGNLLREYTVLLDPPVFVSGGGDEMASAGEPDVTAANSTGTKPPAGSSSMRTDATAMNGQITTAVAATPDALVSAADNATDSRPAEPASTAATAEPAAVVSASEPESAEPAAASAPAQETVFGNTPVFLQVARDAEQAERQLRERLAAEERARTERPAATNTATEVPGDSGQPGDSSHEVREGDTLWEIAAQIDRGGANIQQMMLALLRYNPDAFVDDNINRLKQGYVLHVPDADVVGSLSARQAIARVREQNALWREWRDAISGTGTALAATATAPAAGKSAPVTGEGSRLTIVGADEGGASTNASATATAGGGTAAEKLALLREQLESARAEKVELSGRVGDLEQMVDKMERLITLREDQLAQLQAQLQEIQQGATGSGAATADASATTAVSATDTAVAGNEAAAEDSATGGETADASADGTTIGADETGDNTGTVSSADANADAAAETDASGSTAAAAAAATSARTQAMPERGVVTTRTQPAKRTWLDTVNGLVAGGIAAITGIFAGDLFANPLIPGAVVLLVLGAGLIIVRRRRAADEWVEEEDEDADGFVPGDTVAMEAGGGADFGDGNEAFDEDWSDFFSETQEGAEDADSGLTGGDAGEGGSVGDDWTGSDFDLDALEATAGDAGLAASAADGALAEETDDTTDEAGIYIAYGLYQQAEDLLRLALEEHPTRQNYHEKLLEALYAAEQPEKFVAATEAFLARVDEPHGPAWQRIATMGREIAPDSSLFDNDGKAADMEVDLDLSDAAPASGAGDDFGLGETDDGFARAIAVDTDEFDPIAIGGDPVSSDSDDLGLGDESMPLEATDADDDQFAQAFFADLDESDAIKGDAGLSDPDGGEAGIPALGTTDGDKADEAFAQEFFANLDESDAIEGDAGLSGPDGGEVGAPALGTADGEEADEAFAQEFFANLNESDAIEGAGGLSGPGDDEPGEIEDSGETDEAFAREFFANLADQESSDGDAGLAGPDDGERDDDPSDEPGDEPAALGTTGGEKADEAFAQEFFANLDESDSIEGDGGLSGPGDGEPDEIADGDKADDAFAQEFFANVAESGDGDAGLSGTEGDQSDEIEAVAPVSNTEFAGAEAGDLSLGSDDLPDDPGGLEDVPLPSAAGDDAQAVASSDGDGFDFDLSDLGLGEDSDQPEDSGETIAAGNASEAGEADAAIATAASDDGAIEFDLSDLGLGEDSDGSKGAGGADGAPEAGEADTAMVAAASDDGAFEFDLTDLGLDGDASGSADGAGDIAATAAESDDAVELGDALDFDFEASGVETADTSGDAVATDSGDEQSEEDALLAAFTGEEGEIDLDGAEEFSEGADAVAPATDDPAFDFDLGDLERELEQAAPELEADLAADESADGEAGDDEDFDTMLDLARAYIDMGDGESASHALEEIIAAGNEKQQTEARELLETVQ